MRVGGHSILLMVLLGAGCQSLQSQLAGRGQPSGKTETTSASKPRNEEKPEPTSAEAKPVGQSAVAPLPVPAVNSPPKPAPVAAEAKASESIAMAEEVPVVGKLLAEQFRESEVRFQFDSIKNPRSRLFHTPDGHIYVSEGLLKRIERKEDLAAVLAMEMAQLAEERRAQFGSSTDETPPPAATGTPTPSTNRAKTPSEDKTADLKAKELVKKAGFSPTAVVRMRQQLRAWEDADKANLPMQEVRRSLAN